LDKYFFAGALNTVADDIDATQLCDNRLLSRIEDGVVFMKTFMKPFTLITQNIRSHQCNLDYFKCVLKRANLMPDVIVLTECWLPVCPQLPVLHGYNCFASDQHYLQNDGVIIFVKEQLSVKVQKMYVKEANSLCLTINNEIDLIGIYRSPSYCNPATFIDSLNTFLSRRIDCRHTIITGDMNINIVPNACSSGADDYLNVCSEHGFYAGNILPTRGKNCLDHVMIKSKHKAAVITCNEDITDHSLIMTLLDYAIQNEKRKYTTKIDLNAIDYEIKSIDWSLLYELNNIDDACDFFCTSIVEIIEKYKKVIPVSNSELTIKHWITPGLLKCIRKRSRLHLQAIKNPNDVMIQTQYKKYRNTCCDLLKETKAKHHQRELLDARLDAKKTWKTVKSVCNIAPTRTQVSELLRLDTEPTESLNKVNTFFSSVGRNLAEVTLNRMGVSETYLAKIHKGEIPPVSSLFLRPTDTHEVASYIRQLKSGSSPGLDGITPDILKTAISSVVEPLTYICNLSIISATFPNILKVASITPIFKTGSREEVTNYRPISLLSVIGKIIEKIINSQLLSYLERNNSLSPNQFGFRQKRSTEQAVDLLVDKIVDCIDKGEKCVGIFLDLAKAFDTVSIPILLAKLESLGIRGLALKWFESYLSDRRQCVRVENQSSDLANIDFGVPQGSVLGPTLFLTYINGLCKLKLTNATTVSFADDTAILVRGKDWLEVQRTAESNLKLILEWLDTNLLVLNVQKTKYVSFSMNSRGQPCDDFCIRVRRQNDDSLSFIESAKTIKYLGVLLDSHLSWRQHIESVKGRVRKLMFVFRSLRNIAYPELLRTVYFALCESVLGYCNSVWGGAAKTHLISLERAQRSLLKVIFRKPSRYSTKQLYKVANVLSVRQLFLRKIMHNLGKLHSKIFEAEIRRRQRWKTPRTLSKFAQRFHPFISPLVMRSFCKCHVIKRPPGKQLLTEWLKQLDYHETENLLTVTK
jgi:hypothetical protein